MSVDSAQHEQSILSENKALAPSLLEYTQNVLSIIEPGLKKLAERAIGTVFNPENSAPITTLASNSIREQLTYQLTKDPTIVDRFKQFGIGAVIDSKKLQDVNLLSSPELGDSYILRNMESIITFAQEEKIDVMLGRYSGDEIIAFFIPNGELSAEVLEEKFITWNKQFLAQSNPVNDRLQSLEQEIQRRHGIDAKIGASIKAVNLKDVTFSKKNNTRGRQLLGDVIDAVEHKIKPGKDNLGEQLLINMMEPRKLTYAYKEIPWFPELLPGSILDLFQEAKMQGADPAVAGAYAEDATFESLYPRLRVYRMEVFEEMIKKYTRKHGDIVLVKSGDPYLKWTNTFVSHHAGDERMLGIVDHPFVETAYLGTAQKHGSFIHMLPADHLEIHNRATQKIMAEQPEAVLDPDINKPTAFRVITSGITDTNGSTIYSRITPNTSKDEIRYIIELLGAEQTTNEITTLLTRVGAHVESLSNFIKFLSVRINRLEEARAISKKLNMPLDEKIAEFEAIKQK